MTDTYTFIKQEHNGRFQFTVKTEFIKKVKVDDCDTYQLISQHNMQDYLHNPLGPAIVYMEGNRAEYFINGKLVTGEDAEKIKHTSDFNNKYMDFLNAPEEK